MIRPPVSGVGLGLRWDFIDELLETEESLDFVEISPENYMGAGVTTMRCSIARSSVGPS